MALDSYIYTCGLNYFSITCTDDKYCFGMYVGTIKVSWVVTNISTFTLNYLCVLMQVR